MSNFNEQFTYSIIIIALGYFLKKCGIIKEKDGEGLARIIFNLTLPALIIVTFNDLKMEPSLFLLSFIAFIYGVLIAFVSIFIFRKQRRDIKGMLTMMVPGFNIGLFAFPLVEGIFGKVGIQYFSMFDVGNSFIVFGVSYLIGSYYAGENVSINLKTISFKMIKSIPFMTYIIVVLYNVFALHLPSILMDTASIISVANMPLSLLLLGIYLNFHLDKKYALFMVKYMLLKYSVGLIVGVGLFLLLPFDEMFRYTLLIGMILPTVSSVLPYAVEFNYDKRFVGTVCNLSIVTSFLLIWLLVNFVIG